MVGVKQCTEPSVDAYYSILSSSFTAVGSALKFLLILTSRVALVF
jgi:hypothetical protein